MCLFSFACLSTSLDCGQRQGAGWDWMWVGLQDLNKRIGDSLQDSVVRIEASSSKTLKEVNVKCVNQLKLVLSD